jgi:PBSX family phage terminase large subunit
LITDEELIELERLVKEQETFTFRKQLTTIDDLTSPNYKVLYESINNQKWGFDEHNKPILKDGYAGCVLEGSSRSTKTWSGVDIIIYLCTVKHKDKPCSINIYRETYNEFKTTLYDDFKRRLDDFDLDNPFHRAKEIGSFKIGKSKIHFLGDGKHGGGCDYAFFNEAMMIKQEVFDQVEMRCRVFWWMDYNPSFTEHWVFNSVIPRNDVAFKRTTFKDNRHISATELNKILSYEPWEPGTYEVIGSEIFYKDLLVDEHNQPPSHVDNIEQGTSDEFMWKVYGLGLRGAMKGQIFKNVTYIDKFPNIAHTWGLDLGFTTDPAALVKFAKEGNNIYLQLEIYEPIETSAELSAAMEAVGVSKYDPITADSSDKYVSEKKGTVQMVRELYEMGWEISKVSKTKGVMYWILKMKECKIHIVRNRLYKHAKKEQENYVFKEVNGILINQPEDKENHFWDGSRYSFMNHDFNNFSVTTN